MACKRVNEFLTTASIENHVEINSRILKVLYLKCISELYVSTKDSHKNKEIA